MTSVRARRLLPTLLATALLALGPLVLVAYAYTGGDAGPSQAGQPAAVTEPTGGSEVPQAPSEPPPGEVPSEPEAPSELAPPASPPPVGSTASTGDSGSGPGADDTGSPQAEAPQSPATPAAPTVDPVTEAPVVPAPSGELDEDPAEQQGEGDRGSHGGNVAGIAAAVSAPQQSAIRPAVVGIAETTGRTESAGADAGRPGRRLERRTTIARAVDGIPLPFRAALLLMIFISSVLSIVTLRERRRAKAVARVAQLDHLTGLANREGFDRQMAIEWQRALRHGRELGLVFVDLDDFKGFNDTYGHVAGDRLLREVAAAITATSRGSDFTARLGGDEFVVICPDADADGLARLVERLRVESAGIGVTLSIGAANRLASDLSSDELVHRADVAMYSSKGGGRRAPSSTNPMLGSLRRS